MFKKVEIFLSIIILVSLSQSAEITILYSGSANGILESCHCPGNPFGGLVNRATVIDSFKKADGNVIVVDVGDFLPVEGDSLKSSYVLKALEYCSLDAAAPGDQDFIFGKDYAKDSGVPFISPSIFDIQSRSYLFQTYKVFDYDSVKIAVTSLFNPDLFRFFPDSIRNSIGVEKPEATWKRFGSLMREQADIVVVLSHMGYENDVEFLQKYEGIDILVSGHSQVFLAQPDTVGSALLLAPGKNGEHLGRLTLTVDSLGGIAEYDHEIIPLIAEEVGESAEIRELIEEYDHALHEELKRKAIAAGRKFNGNAFCGACHAAELEHWQTTAHAHALETLEKMGKAGNSSCIDCHTTGFGYPGGFVSKKETSQLGGIGCEECHRIPPNVEFGGNEPHRVLPLIEKWCTRCHKKPHIVEFDFETMKKDVQHND